MQPHLHVSCVYISQPWVRYAIVSQSGDKCYLVCVCVRSCFADGQVTMHSVVEIPIQCRKKNTYQAQSAGRQQSSLGIHALQCFPMAQPDLATA